MRLLAASQIMFVLAKHNELYNLAGPKLPTPDMHMIEHLQYVGKTASSTCIITFGLVDHTFSSTDGCVILLAMCMGCCPMFVAVSSALE